MTSEVPSGVGTNVGNEHCRDLLISLERYLDRHFRFLPLRDPSDTSTSTSSHVQQISGTLGVGADSEGCGRCFTSLEER